MGSDEQFCLRWNDFETNIKNSFYDLRAEKDFADMTLVCGDGKVEAHKVILSAGSTFFQKILKENTHSKPLIYLKGVKLSELNSVLNFVYHGEASTAQANLSSFLDLAEDLKVKGLRDWDRNKDKIGNSSDHTPQPPAPPSASALPLLAQRPPPSSALFNNNSEKLMKTEPLDAPEKVNNDLHESGFDDEGYNQYDDYNQHESFNQEEGFNQEQYSQIYILTHIEFEN